MLLRGTRIIEGTDAYELEEIIDNLRTRFGGKLYHEVIIPSIWSQDTFVEKAGPEILEQMYTFEDKKGREICLIPEVTAIIEELYNGGWKQSRKKPIRLFYVQRCYRYERPQEGRYREFLQFGVEHLGNPDSEADKEEIMWLLTHFLIENPIFDGVEFVLKQSVKRGLDYYVEDGFEVECPILGAQKQVAGGGRYESGIGFAIGLDRLLLALKLTKEKAGER